MTRSILCALVKRTFLAAAAICLAGVMTAKPADAQISIQVPFVSLGIGAPYYGYPYYYYGYPYYYRTYYGGWRHRNWCHWHPYRCGRHW